MAEKLAHVLVAEDSGVPMEQSLISSYDGTPIVYRVRRAGPRWLVIANGYAGTFLEWKAVLPRLDPRLSLLMWDYRGMFRSGHPSDPSHLTIEDDSRDLEQIMARERIDRAVLLGWSVGAQVVLEHYRRRPEQVQALVLHNGLAQQVLSEALDRRVGPVLLRPFVAAMARVGRLAHLSRPLMRAQWTPKLLRAMGVVVRHEDHFSEAVRSITHLDLGTYFRMVRFADQHRTEDIWPQVRVPVLVTYGRRDLFSPKSHAERVAAAMPDARVRELSGGHYSLMEYPEELASILQEFLDQVLGETHS